MKILDLMCQNKLQLCARNQPKYLATDLARIVPARARAPQLNSPKLVARGRALAKTVVDLGPRRECSRAVQCMNLTAPAVDAVGKGVFKATQALHPCAGTRARHFYIILHHFALKMQIITTPQKKSKN